MEAVVDQGAYKFFNPNHDPHSGEFSSGGGGGASSGGAKSSGRSRSSGRTRAAAKPKGEAKPRATKASTKPAEEDMHAKAARLQREGHLPEEVKPGSELEVVPGGAERAASYEASVFYAAHAKGDPFADGGNSIGHLAHGVKAHSAEGTEYLRQLYGEHQLGAALSRYSVENVRARAESHGLSSKGTKATLVSRITAHATGGRYSANFGKGSSKSSAAEAHAAKATVLKARLDKAQAAYDAHMAKAPKLSERTGWREEGRRLLREVRRCQMALYDAMPTPAWRAPGYGGAIQLDEAGSDGFHRSWIMLFPEGEYEHPQYGDLTFSRARLSEIKRLFDQRVRHIDIALDANHDQDKATGWLEQLQLREGQASGAPAGLWGLVRWTPYGVQLLKDQLYRYFSPEFGPWTDPASGKKYDNVLIGGGLTNRPFLKEMPAVALSEVSQKSWASVDKAKLPAACFLIVGDRAKKSTWRLPVYEGAGGMGSDGMYARRGALNINAVRAALAALGGARSGKPMTGVPSGLQAKLEGWLKRYGGEKGQSSQQANESDGGVVEDHAMTVQFDEDTQSFIGDEDDDTQLAEAASEDDATELAEDDSENESYADDNSEDPDDDGDDDSNANVDADKDTHGAFEGRHQHGKFAMHSHDGDGDHSDAKLKASKGGKKMGERLTSQQLRETVDQQAQQLAEMREALYRRDVADTLASWDAGKFQFSDAPTTKAGATLPMVALSKRFRDQYTALMLGEAAGLPASVRKAINRVIETGLSAAVVDLSQRGASFDQERRRTVRGGQNGQRAEAGNEVLELAEKLAEQSGKRLAEMGYEAQLRLMAEAERQSTGSNTLPF